MHKPFADEIIKNEEVISAFSGYKNNLRISESSFFDEENITSDFFPVFSPRSKRAWFNVNGDTLHGLFSKSSLGYINNGVLYYGGHAVIGMKFPDIEKERQFVSLGAKLLVFPDKIYLNTKDLTDFGSLEAEFTTAEGGTVNFSLCKSDGSLYEGYTVSATAPSNPVNNTLWFDTSITPNELKQYSEYSDTWVTIVTTYVRIAYPGIGENFNQYDGVKISGAVNDDFNGAFVIWDKGDDFVVVTGVLSSAQKQQTPLTISRSVPDMDFVCENGNRIWGCSSEKNELYSCKLGDPTNWNCFMGIASDSYAVSLGTDGKFTGGISHKGYVLFFKENCVHKIYGANPPFTVNTSFIRGVQKGSEKSLVSINETLYYKSPNGVVMYDGSLPINISEALGNEYYSDAVAGSLRDKYYICMTDKNNDRVLFVYDETKRIWHKEGKIDIKEFAFHNCNLYFIRNDEDGTRRLYLADAENKFGNFEGELSGYFIEADIEWMAETGMWGLNLPEKKYYSGINIRLVGSKGAKITIYFQYNSNGKWVKKVDCNIEKTGSLNIPVVTPRCDHFKMKLEGKGDIKIFSISRKIEKGSEK